MEQEYFKPIKNFETYGISNLGNVKDFRTGEIKRQYVNEKAGGYLQVQIKNPSGSFSKRVHRLVGENLIDNPNNLEEIDHIDRNRINNRIDNLRWVSRSDNQINKLYDSHNNNPYKCIHYDEQNTTKNPYSCWCIQIKNKKLTYKKRFRTDKYTLDYVKKIRDDLFKKYDIPLND
jgi:hypothetical protein